MAQKSWDEKILAYALKNAIEHEGNAVEGSVISALFHEGLEKSQIKDVIRQIKECVRKVNLMKPEEQIKEYKNFERFTSQRDTRAEDELPELENVDKKNGVIMRFRPAPSGPLHIGHII